MLLATACDWGSIGGDVAAPYEDGGAEDGGDAEASDDASADDAPGDANSGSD